MKKPSQKKAYIVVHFIYMFHQTVFSPFVKRKPNRVVNVVKFLHHFKGFVMRNPPIREERNNPPGKIRTCDLWLRRPTL